jgi:hypothetical protein
VWDANDAGVWHLGSGYSTAAAFYQGLLRKICRLMTVDVEC